MSWTRITRRTAGFKLLWFMQALRRADISCRLNGESFHAPILEVESASAELANAILFPIDHLDDDDPMFARTSQAQAWWGAGFDQERALMFAGIGLVAARLLVAFNRWQELGALSAESEDIEALLFQVSRVKVFASGLGLMVPQASAGALGRCREILRAADHYRQRVSPEASPPEALIAFCLVLADHMTQGTLGDLVLSAKGCTDLISRVMAHVRLGECDTLVYDYGQADSDPELN